MDTIKIDKKDVKIIAHRGVSGLEKENTCPAFIAAGNRSYFGIETDVHVTKDGKFIIMHDCSIARVTAEEYDINVETNDYSAVKDIVLPDIDGSKVRNDIRIPLLEEYIHICKKYEKKCILELKNYMEPSDIARLIDEIKALGYFDNMIFISFDLNNCIELRKLLPEATIQYLIGVEVTEEDFRTLEEYRFDLDVTRRVLTKEIVDKVHSLGLKVNCWTVNEKEEAEKLIAMGVDYITTNILE